MHCIERPLKTGIRLEFGTLVGIYVYSLCDNPEREILNKNEFPTVKSNVLDCQNLVLAIDVFLTILVLAICKTLVFCISIGNRSNT